MQHKKDTIKIKVKPVGQARHSGLTAGEYELLEGSKVKDLLNRPELKNAGIKIVLIEGIMVDKNRVLRDGEEVKLLPSLIGG